MTWIKTLWLFTIESPCSALWIDVNWEQRCLKIHAARIFSGTSGTLQICTTLHAVKITRMEAICSPVRVTECMEIGGEAGTKVQPFEQWRKLRSAVSSQWYLKDQRSFSECHTNCKSRLTSCMFRENGVSNAFHFVRQRNVAGSWDEQWGGGDKRLSAPPLEVQRAPVYPMSISYIICAVSV